jgi:hypothetical protein
MNTWWDFTGIEVSRVPRNWCIGFNPKEISRELLIALLALPRVAYLSLRIPSYRPQHLPFLDPARMASTYPGSRVT